MILLVCTEGDSELEPNFSLSVYSYSDSSVSKISSLHEVSVCVLSGRKNVEWTKETEKILNQIKQKEKNH